MNRFRNPTPEASPRKCSECGHELYADEDLICQECEDNNELNNPVNGGDDD